MRQSMIIKRVFETLTSNYHLVEFFVDGATIPEVDFDVGPSWSGLIPISSAPNETRKVNLTE